jgi:hypothetical protein
MHWYETQIVTSKEHYVQSKKKAHYNVLNI